MNSKANMIIANGEIITPNVKFCKYNNYTHKYDITFYNGKTYSYNYLNVVWLREPEVLDYKMYKISHFGRELFNICGIYVFCSNTYKYWHICFENGTERDYNQSELEISKSVLDRRRVKDVLNYLYRCTELSSIKSENRENLLSKQYRGLSYLGEDTALSIYLEPYNESYKNNLSSSDAVIPIFPFGCNSSQFKAVKNALKNKISIIEGPPGTGKTQTILNIIANLLVLEKSIQVVSNNNTAINNIVEKLEKYGLDFIAATLGKSENKQEFISTQTGKYPDISIWNKKIDNKVFLQNIQACFEELQNVFSYQERIAVAKQELNKLETEWHYFSDYLSETENSDKKIVFRKKNISSSQIMSLWQECQMLAEHNKPISLLFKMKCRFIYGISNHSFYKNSLNNIISTLQAYFYRAKINELRNEITLSEAYLKNRNAAELSENFRKMSMEYLQSVLYHRYADKKQRRIFTQDDLWKNFGEVQKEFPVILSTTFSSRSSLCKDAKFDYVIMDEASQVDIATGVLALSNSTNAVIVGDTKQLPNVMTEEDIKKAESIFKEFNIPQGYNIARFSFLQSVCNLISYAPRTLLREHYRCHPKIIDFCNQKFYNGQLIIMTQDNGEEDVLTVLKSVKGNHARGHYNQRQIDMINQEILPNLSFPSDEIGIIAPYNAQVSEIERQIYDKNITVATVHKFQGREKDAIILTTVDNEISDFIDDPYLLNVAISRAKNKLYLVTSGNDISVDSNISDLINYIEYQNFTITDSKLYSVFDYLYTQFTKERMIFLKKRKKISEFDSENLMYSLLTDTINELHKTEIGIICHQPLNMLIRDPYLLNDEECRYAMNNATHLDFLLYNRITQKTLLAIEVDGYKFHKPDTKQAANDRMKNLILEKYGIPYIRFATNGSGEKEKLISKLNDILQST